jgi:hypothetical protein
VSMEDKECKEEKRSGQSGQESRLRGLFWRQMDRDVVLQSWSCSVRLPFWWRFLAAEAPLSHFPLLDFI